MKRKKYNPQLKQRQRIAASLKRYLVVYFVTAEQPKNEIGLYDFKGNAIPVTANMAHIIENHKHKWSVMLGVFYKEKGMANCSMRIVDAVRHCKQSELVETLNDTHQDFIASKSRMGVSVTGAGWIASPVGLDLSEELCGGLFDRLGALK